MKALNLLWMSNGPQTPSGYGNQTALFAPRIKRAGHGISIFAFYGLEGAPIMGPDGVMILPRLQGTFGNDVVTAHVQHTHADALMTLVDPRALLPHQWDVPYWCAWAPIDSQPVAPDNATPLRQANRIWAMSKFGRGVLEAGGFGPVDYVPHGIDTQVFRPVDRRTARQKLMQVWGRPDLANKFLVVSNAANKGTPSRKNFDATFQAWAAFHEQHPESVLYLHTDREGIWKGEHLPTIMQALSIPPASVIFPPRYEYLMGMLPPEYLNDVYNAGDVYLTTSRGEGFGIPIVEAQAAGCPVIVGDYTAMPELCFGGWTFSGMPFMYAEGSYQYLALVPQVVDRLNAAHNEWRDKRIRHRRETAARRAQRYDADRVFADYMQPALERIAQDVQRPRLKSRTPPRLIAAPPANEMLGVSIITPWRDHPELIPDYENAMSQADEVIIVDNASTPQNAALLFEMTERLGGIYIRNDENRGFAAANNQGLAIANGDVIAFVNNDVQAAPTWVHDVTRDTLPDTLAGASAAVQNVDGRPFPYLEGWCIAGQRAVWEALGGWDAEAYGGMYWEDNDLCFHATQMGFTLLHCDWPIVHLGNTTSRHEAAAYEDSEQNQATFMARVRAA